MKPFLEALKDCFVHTTDITDPMVLKKMRQDGIRIDDEGYYVFSFGDHKEYELRVLPYGEDGQYLIELYKNAIPLINKLPIWIEK